MTYSEIIPIARQGKLIKLPNFESIFKWDYGKERLIFNNRDFYCNAMDLDIANRTEREGGTFNKKD